MKKKWMIVVALFATVMFIPNAYALTLAKVEQPKTVPADEFTATTVNVSTDGNTIEYKGVEIATLDSSNSAPGRTAGYGWIGVRINAPTEGVTLDNLKNNSQLCIADSTGKCNDKKNQAGTPDWQKFWDAKDSDAEEQTPANHFINVYEGVTDADLQEALQNNTTINTYIAVDWDGDSEKDQLVTLIIDPKEVTLYESTEKEKKSFDGPEEYKKIQEANNEPAEKEEQNPDTSDINILFLVAMILVGGCGITYTIKRNLN